MWNVSRPARSPRPMNPGGPAGNIVHIGLEFLTGELLGCYDQSGVVFTVLATLSRIEREYLRDRTRARPRVERGAVGGQLPVKLGELRAQLLDLVVRLVDLCLSEVSDGHGQPVGTEHPGEPPIQRRHDVGLAQVHRARVLQLVGPGVRGRKVHR